MRGRDRWTCCARVWRGWTQRCLPHLDRAITLLREGGEARVRQAASALYHVTSAAAMRWEGERLGDAARGALADQVMTHRVLPRDPLAM